MRILLAAYGLLAYTAALTSATALTYKIAPNEKACFFTFVEKPNAKVAVYFAVRAEHTTFPRPLESRTMRAT